MAMAMANENVGVMRSHNSELVISDLAKEFDAKMASLSRSSSRLRRSGGHSSGRSLDLCLRLDDSKFMCLSIPNITTSLESLSSFSKCKNQYHHHEHDEIPNRLDTNYDILADRFPCILPDFEDPFPLPGTTFPLFSSAVVGRTLYILGGEPNDIEGLDEIDDDSFEIYPYSQPGLPKRKKSSPPTPPPHAQLDNIPTENTPKIQCQCDDWGFDTQKTTSTPVWDWDDEFLKLTPPTALTSPTELHTTKFTIFTDDDGSTDPNTITVTGHVDKAFRMRSVNPIQVKLKPFTMTKSFLHCDDPFPVITASTLSPKTMPASLTTIPEYPNEPIKGICHKIYTFDLDNPDLGWSEGKSLISPRIYPKLVPYQGKLYAFSGNHPSLTFAEVYDPISATWTALPPAPFRRLHDAQMCVVPLNGWNKLWVFGTHRAVDYTFDVLTQKWHKFSGARVILPHFAAHQNLVSALTPKKHMVVYWLNQKEEVYAYNLSTNQIFKGIISGAKEKKPLLDLGLPLVLHHLRRDLFCLIGCTFRSNPNPNPRILHVVILQISFKTPPTSSKPLMPTKASSKIHKTPPNPLSAAVLACFAYPLKGKVGINDTYIMSKNV